MTYYLMRGGMKILVSFLRFFLAIIFLIAFFSKVLSFNSFVTYLATILNSFSIGTNSLVTKIFAIAALALEFLISFSLITKVKLNYSVLLSIAMSIIFIFINLSKFLIDSHSDCNCFGDIITLDILDSIFLDFVMLLAGLYLLNIIEKDLRYEKTN